MLLICRLQKIYWLRGQRVDKLSQTIHPVMRDTAEGASIDETVRIKTFHQTQLANVRDTINRKPLHPL
jgi:hypothetical protein